MSFVCLCCLYNDLSLILRSLNSSVQYVCFRTFGLTVIIGAEALIAVCISLTIVSHSLSNHELEIVSGSGFSTSALLRN